VPPAFQFSCGLYDKNSPYIEEFARFAVALGIHTVGFWNLATWHHEEFPYENTDVPESDRAYPLDTLTREELLPRLDAIQSAISILNANGVHVQVNGNFIETLTNQCRGISPGQEDSLDGIELPEGMTRDCIDPWIYAEVDTNGDVKPCCARGGVGNLARAEFHQILDDAPIRQLRENLLNGTNDEDCIKCPLRPPTMPEELHKRVRALFEAQQPQDQTNGANRAAASSAGKVMNLISSAVGHVRAGRKTTAFVQLSQALAIDPGINIGRGSDDSIRLHLETILSKTHSPATLTWLAAFCREIGDRQSGLALLRRYLEVVPDAPDREHVIAGILAEMPPKKSAREILERIWVRARIKIQLRTRLRSVIGISGDRA
jgi:hypothetical protein